MSCFISLIILTHIWIYNLFKLIFVYGMRWGLRITILPMDVQMFQYHLKKTLLFVLFVY